MREAWSAFALGRRVGACVVALAAFAATAVPGAAAAAPIDVHDDRGIVVRVVAPPTRIVSMLPSLTETVCALGACERLVGVDTWSNQPAAVRALPRVGGLDDANVERIVALRPDVVLLAVSARVITRLEALGLPVLALEPRTAADVRRVSVELGRLLGGDAPARADAMWASIQSQIDEAARSLPAAARGQSVYCEVDSGPYAAGESSFIGELLIRLSARNVVPAALGPFPKLNPEFVVRADPQVMMVGSRQIEEVRSRPGWAGIRALRDGRVCGFDRDEGDVLVRPGPRMGEAARLIARCLRAADDGARADGGRGAGGAASAGAKASSSGSAARGPDRGSRAEGGRP